MNIFNLAIVLIAIASSCKSSTNSNLLESSDQSSSSPIAKSYAFCRLDFGDAFYSNSIHLSSHLKFRFVKPYKDISDKLTTEIWKTKCSGVNAQTEAFNLIQETAEMCAKFVRNYDSSYLFSDVWFESRREEKRRQLVGDMSMVCQHTEQDMAGWVKSYTITYDSPLAVP